VPQLLWDASALSKRYFLEVGSDSVDALFTVDATIPRVTTYFGYAETCATLRRRFNRGEFDLAAFTMSRFLLRDEVLLAPEFLLVTIEDDDILAGVALTDQHNLNTSDSVILATCLRYARAQPPTAPPCILIAADRRLVRAAQAESLRVLNPEVVAAAGISALLAAP
jgi:predicted nucleic acid-binding protein